MGLVYQKDLLHFGEEYLCPLLPLAQEREHPFYLYDIDGMRARVKKLRGLSVHYAMKANSSDRILRTFREEGAGVDVVSGGEISVAMRAGFPASSVIFSGVGKTRGEIELAVGLGIKQINVESPEELQRIVGIARALGKKPKIAFRMNPDVDAKTHPYISTGLRENKFGMGEHFLPELKAILRTCDDAIDFCGLTMHIGSQLQDLAPLEDAIRKTREIFSSLLAEGYKLRTFDVGGGLGIPYTEEHTIPSRDFSLLDGYMTLVARALADFKGEILCEPGRILVGSCGTLVSEVQYVKASHRIFLILNTGMHHLIRPALYKAHHRVMPLQRFPERALKEYDVVGPICESSDFLGRQEFQETKSGEFLAIADTGAYGFAMASTYNEHPLPEQLYWEKGKLS